MPRILTLAVVVLFTVTSSSHATEKEAKEILARAIKAHGGAAALTKAARSQRTDTGKLALVGRQVPFVSKISRDLPDRVRMSMDVGKDQKTVLVLDGNKAYQNDGSTTIELQAQRVKELREEVYIDWLMTLVPMTKTGFTLSSLAKTKIDGSAVVGIKVAHKGMPDVSMYFLESSGLLVRVEWRGSFTGFTVSKQRQCSAYKEFGGVKLHTKEASLINDRKFNEFTISDVTFPAKFAAKTFAKP